MKTSWSRFSSVSSSQITMGMMTLVLSMMLSEYQCTRMERKMKKSQHDRNSRIKIRERVEKMGRKTSSMKKFRRLRN